MPWRWPRTPIQKVLVPSSDLGLTETDLGVLDLPADVGLGLAVQVGQSPLGSRIVQLNGAGSPAQQETVWSTPHPLAAETASGFTPPLYVGPYRTLMVLVAAGTYTGTSPTLAVSVQAVDPTPTWSSTLANAAAIASASSAYLGLGPGVGGPAAGLFGVIATYPGPLPQYVRLRWAITGTNPSCPFRAEFFLQ